jgi:hypothetical protein
VPGCDNSRRLEYIGQLWADLVDLRMAHIPFRRLPPREEWNVPLESRCTRALLSFIAPEVIVGLAVVEWWQARRKVIRFRGMSFQQTRLFDLTNPATIQQTNGGMNGR